ncbi:MAG: immunoglobulin domain-containing protein [Acidobacteria bacterium]|nr:immunoglobulin domain-containing protein [Acidobacteriota bacterium]
MTFGYPFHRALPSIICLALPALAQQTMVDDRFADGDSQNQSIATNSLRLFNGRTTSLRTDQAGSVTFDLTATGGSSEAVWAYFTDPGKPVSLGLGDKLIVSVTFSVSGFQRNGQDIRWGVLDSLGTRNTANLTAGHNDASFVNDTGYGLQYYASGVGGPFVLGRRTALANQNMFNNFADFATISGAGASERQALADDTEYTLTYGIERLTATTTRLTASVSAGTLTGYNYTAVESNPQPNTSFDYFVFRIAGANFARAITFTRLLVEYSAAPPVITSQPQPSSLTVQVGSRVTMSMGASGSALIYQWNKDGEPLTGNATASTPTLTLTDVKVGDSGSYTAVVSNAGGSVTSQPVTLRVSTTPVPPPPTITTQPANTTIVIGTPGALTVHVTGNGLFYQWFKNGVLIPGETAAELRFAVAQTTDSGSYTVVVSNSSGSITSSAASLVVVSAMRSLSFSPANGAAGLCTDTALTLRLDQPARLGRSGRILILKQDGSAVDAIDLAASPQTRLNGGTAFTYFPVMVSGSAATIFPHAPLPANGTYTVVVEPGVLVDADGAPFVGVAARAWSFTTRSALPSAAGFASVVAADGNGDFCTLQAAIDFAPAGLTQPYVISVKPGVYREIIYVPSSKPFLVIRGEDRDNTIIQYANNAKLNGGNSRVMFGVDAPDFTLDNITLHNTTPSGGSQAEAFRANNSRVFLNQVTLKSFQDTTFLQGAALVADSYLEGDVDFMWGGGKVFFQNCELMAVTSGGFYTQLRNGQGQNGNAYVNCRLTAAEGVTGVYLSRTDPNSFPYAQVILIDCFLGPHIHPAGWVLNNATRAPNVQFYEYNSTNFDGTPVDVSQRLADSRQLTEAEAAQWRDPGAFLGWVPFSISAPASAAPGATVNASFSAAIGHNGRDWIGLYEPGASDDQPLSWQYTGPAIRGQLTFATPVRMGKYEFRYFLNDGYTRMYVSPAVTVQ